MMYEPQWWVLKGWLLKGRILKGFCLVSLLVCIALPSQAADSKRLKVLTTIRPLALLVQDVAGEAAEVEVLLTGAASPHHYTLRVSDIQKVQAADLLVWLGPEFERFLTRTLAPADSGQLLTLATLPGLQWPTVAESNDRTGHDGTGHDHAGRDLHLWISPANGAVILTAIAGRLTELRPEMSQQFAGNLAKAQAELVIASAAVKEDLAPLSERGFGVGHDAFRHFVAYFNLNQLAAVSEMPDQSLSARHLMETAQELKSAHCLIVEAGEPAFATARLERLFKIPIVKADPLALNPEIDTYAALITDLGQSFEECLGR